MVWVKLKYSIYLEVFSFSILLSILFAYLHYSFGQGDHIEQLPFVYRTINSNFLLNDFFTNTITSWGPRTVFSKFIASLSPSSNEVPFVYFFLTIISNTLLASSSYAIALNLFRQRRTYAYVATILVMLLPTFGFAGGSNLLAGTMFLPSVFAFPLLVWAVLFGLIGKAWKVSILCGVASLVHPVLGLEVGILIFASMGVVDLIRNLNSLRIAWIRKYFFPVLFFTVFICFSLVPDISGQKIPDKEFIFILAYFRHPHHYVASQFPIINFINLFCYLIIFLIALQLLKIIKSEMRFFIVSFCTLVLLSFVFGYTLVELIPTRVGVIAQAFRLNIFIKLIVLILAGGLLGNLIEEKKNFTSIMVMLFGIWSPPATLLSFFYQWISRRVNSPNYQIARYFALAMFAIIFFMGLVKNLILFLPAIYILLFIVLVITITRFAKIYSLVTLNLLSILMLAIAVGEATDSLYLSSSFWKSLRNITPKIGLSYELNSEQVAMANYAKQYTKADSVFLAPPTWGQFRLVAERALVVDMKAFPFQDLAMREWKSRIDNCYGYSARLGFAMSSDLSENYKEITDSKIRLLSEKYDFEYAILFTDTETHYPAMYENDRYKLVFVGYDKN